MKITRNQSGFTLLEMLISSAIFAIVLFAIYTIYITSQTTSTRGINKIEVQQNARVAMRRMAREIRMAGYDPGSAIPAQGSQTAIQVANANSITFIADVTGDGDSDQVTYQLQGTQLIRESASWVGAAWTPTPPASSELADSVITLFFIYYDANDNVTATLAAIQRITIGITTQEATGGMQQTFPLTLDVRLRNA
ncbi:MAG: prepilin-type N-terminal cleavage/methylation domain-containing protein [candidate division NC10 bacterium]|nr:prepilin-type N-terminal cleavage/methylation domain-containing protein [candidate division NC10 bacterium]